MACMMLSGWQIYNANPLFPFSFPAWATLGGWLGGALAWHFAAMWLFAGNGVLYIIYGLLSGHFRHHFLPVLPSAVGRDLLLALTFRLSHQAGHYNAVQRLLYILVVLLGVVAVLSGLELWKPVQFHTLSLLLGGYETARRLHFCAMAGIAGFILVHMALVALVPRTLLPMITGRARLEPKP
jgi:thiosulfate reductase cytochrome b subunit